MLNQNSAEPQKTKAGDDDANEVMDPHDPIETGTSGTGTSTDPVGTAGKSTAP